MTKDTGTITKLLSAVNDGDTDAWTDLWRRVYRECRAIATRMMSHSPRAASLQATSLVHEAYLRVFGKTRIDWKNSRQFFAIVRRAMDDIVTEEARKYATKKRGGDRRRVPLEEVYLSIADRADRILEIRGAIGRLQTKEPLCSEIVQLRFLCGLSHDETAQVLGLSVAKVRRSWEFASAFIKNDLGVEDF